MKNDYEKNIEKKLNLKYTHIFGENLNDIINNKEVKKKKKKKKKRKNSAEIWEENLRDNRRKFQAGLDEIQMRRSINRK